MRYDDLKIMTFSIATFFPRTNASLPTTSSSSEGVLAAQHSGHHGAMGGRVNASPDALRSGDPTAERRRMLTIKVGRSLAHTAMRPQVEWTVVARSARASAVGCL